MCNLKTWYLGQRFGSSSRTISDSRSSQWVSRIPCEMFFQDLTEQHVSFFSGFLKTNVGKHVSYFILFYCFNFIVSILWTKLWSVLLLSHQRSAGKLATGWHCRKTENSDLSYLHLVSNEYSDTCGDLRLLYHSRPS